MQGFASVAARVHGTQTYIRCHAASPRGQEGKRYDSRYTDEETEAVVKEVTHLFKAPRLAGSQPCDTMKKTYRGFWIAELSLCPSPHTLK